MWDEEWWYDEQPERLTMEVNTEGFVVAPGFYPLKETKMNTLTPDEMAQLRIAADLDSVMPTLDEEIGSMRKSTETKVYLAIAKGELTPDEAMAYWMEMYAYKRLETRIHDKASQAASVTETTRR